MRIATLAWNPSLAQDVAWYQIYRNDGFLTKVPSTTLEYTDVNIPETADEACYYLVAEDRSGLLSEPSQVVCKIFEVVPPPPKYTIVEDGDTFTITWPAADYPKTICLKQF